MKTFVVAAIAAACAAIGSQTVLAQDAKRPIRIVVPFAPGGPVDLGARVIAPKLEDRLKQPVIVENRPGGNAAVGAAAVSTAPADGQTLFLQTVAVMTPVLIKDFALDVLKDMEPVAPIWGVNYFLFTSTSVPASNLSEFVAYAKANPGKLNYGAGTASTMLMAEMLKAKYGVNLVGVPYKGSAPAAIALVGNEIQANFDVAGVLKPHVDAGKARVLFTTAARRSTIYPNAPTAAEAGAPDLQFGLTGGLWAKAGTPRAASDVIGKAAADTMALPEVGEQFAKIGWVVAPGGRDDLMKSVRAEMDFLARAAKAANYKPE